MFIFSVYLYRHRTHVDRWKYGLCLCLNVFESTGFQWTVASRRVLCSQIRIIWFRYILSRICMSVAVRCGYVATWPYPIHFIWLKIQAVNMGHINRRLWTRQICSLQMLVHCCYCWVLGQQVGLIILHNHNAECWHDCDLLAEFIRLMFNVYVYNCTRQLNAYLPIKRLKSTLSLCANQNTDVSWWFNLIK